MVLVEGDAAADTTILLAHGAGAPMNSSSMNDCAGALVRAGLRVVRFEFEYMARRRKAGVRTPPPRAELLRGEYLAAVDAVEQVGRLVIGGKSMGGRVASMVADDLFRVGRISGLLCLGYPFHPIGKPDQLRTADLTDLKTPTLIVQGTRDPFGTREQVAAYKLSKMIEILWLEDADHDLKPRRTISGLSYDDHLDTMSTKVANWVQRL